MKILAIDTSCDETSAAVTEDNRVLSNVVYSQIEIHKQWGGVLPDVARRNHIEKIDGVVARACRLAHCTVNDVDALAVTFGPGLAIALGVGIDKAKELASQYNKPIIPVNHMEGHIYSCFATNSKSNPIRNIAFPCLALLVSGGHTEIVYMEKHAQYKILGETRDDAAGEALDKATRIILNEKVYPGGPVLERLALKGNPQYLTLPIPMAKSNDLDFSYSGIKTALLYHVQSMSDEDRIQHMSDLAASFQQTVFKSIINKLSQALTSNKVKSIVVGGGVGANSLLRYMLRLTARKHAIPLFFPYSKKLFGDNAAMIGVAAYNKGLPSSIHAGDLLERNARAML